MQEHSFNLGLLAKELQAQLIFMKSK